MNAVETALQTALEHLAPLNGQVTTPEDGRRDVTINAGDLLEGARLLLDSGWGYLTAITGLDHGESEGVLEVLVHFCAGAAVLTLRIRLARAGGELASLCVLIPAASVFEREISEMFGVTFSGSPDTRRLFLPDEWPEGVYPLLKESPAAAGEA